MKVLMVGPSLGAKGGISAVVNKYMEGGLQEKITLRYLSTVKDTNKIIKGLSTLFAICKFIFLCPLYDIVHVHMASRNSYNRKTIILKIAHFYGKKTIIHLHGGGFVEFYKTECNYKKQKKISKTFYAANTVIVLSDEWKKLIHDVIGNDNITILHNAVSIPNYEREDFSNANILFLGRLVEEKGIDELIDIIPDISREFPWMTLIICGSGNEGKYKRLCQAREIENKVVFKGWVTGEEKEAILKEANVFVLPSFHEGLPVSMLEAMSFGLVPVVSDVGGIPSVIQNNVNGIIVKPGNKEELKEALSCLLDNNDLKRRLAQNAYNEVRENYNIQNNIILLLRLYQELQNTEDSLR